MYAKIMVENHNLSLTQTDIWVWVKCLHSLRTVGYIETWTLKSMSKLYIPSVFDQKLSVSIMKEKQTSLYCINIEQHSHVNHIVFCQASSYAVTCWEQLSARSRITRREVGCDLPARYVGDVLLFGKGRKFALNWRISNLIASSYVWTLCFWLWGAL